MIADDRAFEVALKLITAPVWVPFYFAYLSYRRVADARARSKARSDDAAAQPAWAPRTEVEHAVYEALVVAGEPINNRRLAELMGCSPGHASRCVAQLEGAIHKARKGREVLISLH